jgi:sortase A
MRRVLRIGGNLLIAVTVLGVATLGVVLFLPEETSPPVATTALSVGGGPLITALRAPAPASGRGTAATSAVTPGDAGGLALVPNEGVRPITRLVIASIDISVEVVPAGLVAVERGVTWQVPAFRVGHAEGTAGAGQVGNAILLGHVTSLHSGHVFQNLERVRTDDVIQLFSDADVFSYRVVSTARVPRSNSDILQPTQTPSLTLITCTGTWLPTIWDYTERLVVHAELS